MTDMEHLTREQLEYYNGHRLPRDEQKTVGRHLLVCAECRDQLPPPTPEQFWAAIFREEPEEEEILAAQNPFGTSAGASTKTVWSGVWTFLKQPLVFSAGALVLLAVFSFLIWLGESNKPDSRERIVRQADSPPSDNNQLPPAGNSIVPKSADDNRNTGNTVMAQTTPSPVRPANNLLNHLETPNKSIEIEDRELAMLLRETPPAVSSLQPDSGMILRNSNGNNNTQNSNAGAAVFSLTFPVGETVLESKPEFRWQKTGGASRYRISIFDTDFNEVLTAEISENRFTPDRSLKRGVKYLWRVAATTADGEVVAPQPPQPPAMFRIAAETVERRLASLKKNEEDRLKLAVFYARQGMLNDARCALEEILAKNPQHKAARRLLARVEKWKKENHAAVQRCGPSTVTKPAQ